MLQEPVFIVIVLFWEVFAFKSKTRFSILISLAFYWEIILADYLNSGLSLFTSFLSDIKKSLDKTKYLLDGWRLSNDRYGLCIVMFFKLRFFYNRFKFLIFWSLEAGFFPVSSVNAYCVACCLEKFVLLSRIVVYASAICMRV